MNYVYVLLSLKDHKFYIGFSEDVKKRLADHNAGRNTSTKSRRPFELIYYEAHFSKEDALRREVYFKTTKGKSTLKQMLRTTLNHVGFMANLDAQANKGDVVR
ncbi:MAG: excinuclease ABC subunit C [Candidatus Omnitrophica bacterium CG11_big_fil_rev_8_21_14_0_20_42_13]|uniref:Excinuclease ABC subunit C n=1 Tax=Candidatus Ghiorseimicrobium undicola TaxID=1974746 RepID=A0A2H0LZB5_9BACT|nr:MAG: excinuclease ABC subunit C [Candidatus Omnitrophica bacterium CG11_big_fil_rev_8_21_14_0_20_42_13]